MWNMSAWYLKELVYHHHSRGASNLPAGFLMDFSDTFIHTLIVSHLVLYVPVVMIIDACF